MWRLCWRLKAPWRTFCRLGTNFIEHYACRGTSLIGAASLSPATKVVEGTGAASRYKLSRSQKSVKVQDLNGGQMRVFWFSGITNLSWEQEQKLRSLRRNPASAGQKV
jgi:hypothetical protein